MNEDRKAIALGFFDGVHMGHASLLERTVQVAEGIGAIPAVITFDVHPDMLVAGKNVPLITSPEERAEIIRRNFGIEEIIVVHFDESMMQMDWRDFIKWLIADFSAVHFVAGHDFHFGYKGEGNPERLVAMCKEQGIGCDIMPKVTFDDMTISSTAIRNLLLDGEIEKANILLGHKHSLTDTVRFGYKLGSKMGTPTINMRFPENVLVPAHGVYAVSLRIEDEQKDHYAVTNIGVRPTVGGTEDVTVESYILDFDGNIYGKRVRLEFHKILRHEMKFASTDELKEQIKRDAQSVRQYFNL